MAESCISSPEALLLGELSSDSETERFRCPTAHFLQKAGFGEGRDISLRENNITNR